MPKESRELTRALFFALLACLAACSAFVAIAIISLRHPHLEKLQSYIVVQYKYDGTPSHCWQIREGKPEIDLTTDHTRIKVINNDFEEAAKIIDIDLKRCTGVYATPPPALKVWRPGERP